MEGSRHRHYDSESEDFDRHQRKRQKRNSKKNSPEVREKFYKDDVTGTLRHDSSSTDENEETDRHRSKKEVTLDKFDKHRSRHEILSEKNQSNHRYKSKLEMPLEKNHEAKRKRSRQEWDGKNDKSERHRSKRESSSDRNEETARYESRYEISRDRPRENDRQIPRHQLSPDKSDESERDESRHELMAGRSYDGNRRKSGYEPSSGKDDNSNINRSVREIPSGKRDKANKHRSELPCDEKDESYRYSSRHELSSDRNNEADEYESRHAMSRDKSNRTNRHRSRREHSLDRNGEPDAHRSRHKFHSGLEDITDEKRSHHERSSGRNDKLHSHRSKRELSTDRHDDLHRQRSKRELSSDRYDDSNKYRFRGERSSNRNGLDSSKHSNNEPDGGKEGGPNQAINNDASKVDSTEPLSKRQKIGNINMKISGTYIPPAKLKMLQESIQDKSSEQYQRIAWEALKKSIVGMTNKVNGSNINDIVRELFLENIIRGRGILSRALIQAQALSPTYTKVYAAFVAIINTKFPEIGELILKRLVIQYKRGFRRNDKSICLSAAKFIAHLLNQEVAHEILMLEMVTHMLDNPTDDSVEIAIATLKECGKKLTQLSPKVMRSITSSVRGVLHDGKVDPRTRYIIEVFFAVQKDGFKDFDILDPELDLVEEDDKYTHLISLGEAVDPQDMLNVFRFDPDYLENEEKYKSVVKEILGDSDDEDDGEDASGEDDEEDEDEEKAKELANQEIQDMTETNQVCLRRKIYLTIQSSLDFEECAHKLLKLELKPGQIMEMCYMILDCCAQQRTYEKFFGLLAQRFCRLNKIYVEPFTEIFENSYKTIHRLETNKLRNVAKFFAHLLYTDAISWMVLAIIKLNEDDTTSSSRIFIKILFQELTEFMGLTILNERVKDVTLQEAFAGLFPRDHPHNTRFAINFFTSIGLGGLTDDLREHLKNVPKHPVIATPAIPENADASSSSSSSSSDSSSSSSSSESSSESSSDSDKNYLKQKRQQRKR